MGNKFKMQSTVLCLALSLPAVTVAQEYLGWLESGGDDWPEKKASLQALGEEFDTSWELYEFLRDEANGGEQLTWEDMAEPEYDWSGIYTRTGGGLQFDPDIAPFGIQDTTAQLTAVGAAARQAKIDQLTATGGGEYDPISDCRPPGHPRWATEPFLKEYIVTPNQTWLINEMVNDVRRVYTDGRDHTSPEDSYATWNGDTIGFWNDGVLTTHTMYLNEGQYQRGAQPNYSNQVEVVERWHKVNGIILEADFWVYDPVNLEEPWYTRQSYTELANDDQVLRIKYWWCGENANNEISIEEDGSSQFPSFDFLDDN